MSEKNGWLTQGNGEYWLTAEAPRQRKARVFSFDQWRMNESEIERRCNNFPGLVSVSICSLDQRLYCAVVYEEATK